jgi:hypothetical protein
MRHANTKAGRINKINIGSRKGIWAGRIRHGPWHNSAHGVFETLYVSPVRILHPDHATVFPCPMVPIWCEFDAVVKASA